MRAVNLCPDWSRICGWWIGPWGQSGKTKPLYDDNLVKIQLLGDDWGQCIGPGLRERLLFI